MRTLTNAIQTGRIAHAFLFVGPRGIGKTSIARILAKALNCSGGPKVEFDPHDDICREIAEGRSLDVIEIDGASHNSVEQVRELNEAIRFAPARGRFKIYYIDEVHMLSIGAFNALLKTLEEPPAHAKFIFATTEVHKLPATIISRCQRFDLKRISDSDIARQLHMIAEKEGVEISPSALRLLARNAEGGLRDAESALDQIISFCGKQITEADVLTIFGLAGTREVWALAEAIQASDSDLAIRRLRKLTAQGKDLVRLTQELLRYHRNLLLYLISPETAQQELDPDEIQHFQAIQPLPARDLLLAWIDELVQLEERIRFALVKEVLFEITLIRLAEQYRKISLEAVIRHLTGKAPELDQPSLAEKIPSPQAASPVAARTTPAPQPESAIVQAAAPAPQTPASHSASSPSPPSAGPNEMARSRFKDLLRKHSSTVLRHACDHLEWIEQTPTLLRLRTQASPILAHKLQSSALQEALRETARKCFGPEIQVELVIDAEPPDNEENESAHARSSPQQAAAVPSASASSSPSPAPPLDKAEFENDPEIRAALKAFEARIIQLKED